MNWSMETIRTVRFWHASDVAPSLADDGFLADPENEYAKYFNPALKRLEAYSSEHALILLGEPGLGKSTVLSQEYERVRSAGEGASAFFFDLATIGSAETLSSALQAPAIASALHSSDEVVVFLDSLDECLLNVRVAVPLLFEILKHWPRNKVRVRITCRAAELPTRFREGLATALDTEPHVLHLAPFRKQDAAVMAAMDGISDPDAFLKELIKRDVVPLAINPITLRLLIASVKADGGFPPSRQELYLKGLTALCRDPRDGNRPPHECTNPEEILVAAARIAAISMYTPSH
jgi:predicted NACHT family NTPase